MQTTKGIKGIDGKGVERDLIPEIDQIKSVLSVLVNIDAMSWGGIDSVARLGLAASLFKIGDEKRVTLSTGETVTLVVLGFDHDNLTAGGKAKITFGMKNLMSTAGYIASLGSLISWKDTIMRNNFLPDLLTKLPADLQAVIKPINKLTDSGNPNSAGIITTSDKLFLMSEVELRGASVNSKTGEGGQYEYYQRKSDKDFIKKLSDGAGAAADWWLRSPIGTILGASGSPGFCITAINGSSNIFPGGAYGTKGISFCFCI